MHKHSKSDCQEYLNRTRKRVCCIPAVSSRIISFWTRHYEVLGRKNTFETGITSLIIYFCFFSAKQDLLPRISVARCSDVGEEDQGGLEEVLWQFTRGEILTLGFNSSVLCYTLPYLDLDQAKKRISWFFVSVFFFLHCCSFNVHEISPLIHAFGIGFWNIYLWRVST